MIPCADSPYSSALVLVWLITEQRQPAWLAPFLCGLLLGGATLFKQPAWVGVILFALWLIVVARRGRQFPAFVLGVLVFPLLTAGIFALQGTLDRYLFWDYSRAFARNRCFKRWGMIGSDLALAAPDERPELSE